MKPVKPPYSFGFFLPHALRWLITGSLLVVLGWAVYIGVRFYHVDNQVYRWWLSTTTSERPSTPTAGSLALHTYRMDVVARVVTGVDRNLSGLAFDTDRRQLIAVVNRPPTLLTMDLEGRVLSRHRLRNAADVEGVAYLGQNRIALVEEGSSRIIVTSLPSGSNDTDIDLRHATSVELDLGEQPDENSQDRNSGFEGLGYDRVRDQLYVAKEHSPMALYRISGLGKQMETGRMAIHVENLVRWLANTSKFTDLSSVDVNPANGHLLLLSDESQSIVELDTSGAMVGSMEMQNLPNGDGRVPQAEGMALGPDGTLYVVSEPNLFYRMKLQ